MNPKTLMKKSFLVIGVEDREIKLMELEFKKKLLNVKRALIFNLSSIEELAPSLNEKIRKDGYTKKTVIVLLPSSRVGNFTLLLPPMPKSELKAIVERELKKNFSSIENVCYEFFVSGHKLEGEEKRREVVVTYVLRDYIDTILRALQECGLTPVIITSPSQALHNILLFSKLSKPGISTAFLDISETKASLILFRENTWFLTREFPLESFEDTSILEKLFVEVNRAFYYFKQKNRGFEINQLILGGSSPILKEITNYLQKNLRIPVLLMEWEILKDFMVSPSFPPSELNHFANSFFLLIGASLNYFVKDAINFIPPELFEKRMLRYRLRGLAISSLTLLFVVLMANKYLSLIQANYNESLHVQKTYLERLSSQINQIELAKRERKLAHERFSLLQSPFKYTWIFYNFLRDLSLILPDGICIEFLEAKKIDGGWQFSLEGSVKASDTLEAQEIFSRYSEKVKSLTYLKNPIISSLQIKSNPMESVKTIMGFKINGELSYNE